MPLKDLPLGSTVRCGTIAKYVCASIIAIDNDAQNAPMLAINRKLGYQPQPGKYLLHTKELW